MHRVLFALAAAGGVCFVMLPIAGAQTVWTGYDFSFSKASNVDPSFPENQDRITDNVWITRAPQGGIFNANVESFWDSESPADTEWATDYNNPDDEIAATNYAALDFVPWLNAYVEDIGTGQLPASLIGRNAVVHLITDNIYLDLRFESWVFGGGGGFSYVRALPPDEPETTGDYTLDGFVDAADYVHWRKTNGDEVPAGTGADGFPDGTIDDADYGFWVTQFGTDVSLGSGGTAIAAPEPAGLTFLLLAIFLTGFVGRRRA
jgi:hypothetical protein